MKKMWKKGISIMLIVMLVGVMAGCGAKEEKKDSGKDDKKETKKELTIGYSVYWMSEFTTLMGDAMQDVADEEGIKLLTSDGNQDPQLQLSQIENFINQGVDAIVCAAIDPDAVAPGIAEAKAAGIPFVAINMVIDNEDVSAYVGPDDVQAGELAAQYVVDQLGGKGNVIVIQGGDGFSATNDRAEGVKNVLDENKDIKALETQSGDWDRAKSESLMENYIQKYGKDIGGVICHNDEMALGAVQALQAAGMDKDVYVSGIDAIADALAWIEEGGPYASVFQDPVVEGKLGLEYAVKLANGEKVDPVDNFIDMTLVNADNVADYK